jgi:hypothetical protein
MPAAAMIILCSGLKFPPTEGAASGVSMGQMLREILNLMFLVLFCSGFRARAGTVGRLGADTDSAYARHPAAGLCERADVRSATLRQASSAQTLVDRTALVFMPAVVAGAVSLSLANSPLTGVLAASVWGAGVCYMRPTMLAIASERFPRGGTVLMGLMGTAGTLSIQFVLPAMGRIFDAKKIAAAGGGASVPGFEWRPGRFAGDSARSLWSNLAL